MANGRTYFIDRLRVVLTALVILHHTAITYGGSGGWFYREVSDSATTTSLVLTVFCAVNQSFFMGMFFLLAGYFTPSALARKGVRRFLQERLVRLGIPLLLFGFVLGPLTVAIASSVEGSSVGASWLGILSEGTFVIGPLWFAWALLLFALAYVGASRMQLTTNPTPSRTLPSSRAWFVAALAVGTAALAIRQIVPVGESILGLQLGYFASYVFLFALGCVATNHRWLERIERRQAAGWMWISFATIPSLFVAAAFAGALEGKTVNFNGGLGLPAITYAFWEPFVAWGIIASLLLIFRTRFNAPNRAWQHFGEQAYGAFIVHAPVVVGLSTMLVDWTVPPVVKFAVVGSVAIVASFALAAALRKLPFAPRVI
jgi:surface polysaccharide O-acyltransferase-like enzyme